MTIPSIQNPTPAVKPQDRPTLVTCAGRRYWLTVLRACGHDELIDINDNRGDYTAHDWAARADIPCAACRRADAEARPTLPTLIQYQPRQYQAAGSSGSGSTRRPTEHKNRRPRTPSRDARIAAAWELYSGADKFLAEVATGQHTGADHVIALAKKFRAQGLRQLRALGVVL